MNRPQQTPTRSAMTINYHPIHPMLVVFPVSFLSTAPVTDALFWWTGAPFWADASFWLVAGGVGMGVLSAAVGLVDFLAVREVRSHIASWSHLLVAVTLLALAACNLRLRWDDAAALFPWGFTLSLVTAALVMIAAWLGGTLTFRHRIGVYEHHSD